MIKAAPLSGFLMLCILAPLASGASLIINGGFEAPALSNGAVATFTSIPGWTINGNIDVLNNLWAPAEGQQVIDLVGNTGPGTYIQQSFATTPGQIYNLTFEYANNVDTTDATANVLLTGASSLLNQNFSHSGSIASNMNWTLFSTEFTADASSTTLRFTHITSPVPDSRGVALDAVDVEQAPEPTVGLLCLCSGFGFCIRRNRHTPRV
jgi:choice-of-anchor C domain-containing protein